VLILCFVILVMATVLMLGRWVRLARSSTDQALRSLSLYGYTGTGTVDPAAPVRPPNMALENRMAQLARRIRPGDHDTALRLRLLQAGLYDTRPSRFLMLRMTSALLFTAVGLMYAQNSSNPLIGLAAVAAGPVLGWMLPDTFLSMRIKRRMAQIERDAADFIDLLAITVQAGLGLDQAIKVAAERLRGPLADEAHLMLNEIRVGQGRQDALRRVAERADTPTIRAFTRTMAQGESMGVSVADILKSLAVDARTRKKNQAEEQAQKAPVKMVFPLAVCIFPGILIVAAGPGVLAIMRELGG
jgi:tight adherence protein C